MKKTRQQPAAGATDWIVVYRDCRHTKTGEELTRVQVTITFALAYCRGHLHASSVAAPSLLSPQQPEGFSKVRPHQNLQWPLISIRVAQETLKLFPSTIYLFDLISFISPLDHSSPDTVLSVSQIVSLILWPLY